METSEKVVLREQPEMLWSSIFVTFMAKKYR